jgi:hypothetical protein
VTPEGDLEWGNAGVGQIGRQRLHADVAKDLTHTTAGALISSLPPVPTRLILAMMM